MKFKQALGLVIGLVVGVVGGILFSKSLRPEPGSMQERVESAEEELARSERRVRAMEKHVGRTGESSKGRLQSLARDVKDGKEVSFDDILGTAKPWMRQIAPVMERVRKVNEADWADARVSEWTRKYDLSEAEQEELKEFFQEKSRVNAERITEVIDSDESGFVDFVQATDNDWRDFDGVEKVMEGFLEGEELVKFQAEQLEKRVETVQNEADRKLQRLDDVVSLDDEQHQQLFGVMVRGAEAYQPEVKPEGFTGEATSLDRPGRDAAIDAVLRPEQREALEEHRSKQRQELEEQWQKYQLAPPRNVDALEGDIF
ncbi:MAG: hypothetical protein ACJAQT_000630 [Akkermansiaceae bacterium]